MARRTLFLTEDQRQQPLQLRDHDHRPYARERRRAAENRRWTLISARGQAGTAQAAPPTPFTPGSTDTKPPGSKV